MQNNYCSKHGIYKGSICNICQKDVIKKIKIEYEAKLPEELRIKIEKNWKIH